MNILLLRSGKDFSPDQYACQRYLQARGHNVCILLKNDPQVHAIKPLMDFVPIEELPGVPGYRGFVVRSYVSQPASTNTVIMQYPEERAFPREKASVNCFFKREAALVLSVQGFGRSPDRVEMLASKDDVTCGLVSGLWSRQPFDWQTRSEIDLVSRLRIQFRSHH